MPTKEYSSNMTDLKLDIGMTIQEIQTGEEIDVVEHLESIQTAIFKMMGGSK